MIGKEGKADDEEGEVADGISLFLCFVVFFLLTVIVLAVFHVVHVWRISAWRERRNNAGLDVIVGIIRLREDPCLETKVYEISDRKHHHHECDEGNGVKINVLDNAWFGRGHMTYSIAYTNPAVSGGVWIVCR